MATDWVCECGVAGAVVSTPGGRGSVMGIMLRGAYRPSGENFEGSKETGGATQTIPCYS